MQSMNNDNKVNHAKNVKISIEKMKVCKFSDRKQDESTDPLAVGVFDIGGESYRTLGRLQTMRAEYAIARYHSVYLFLKN